MSQRVTKSSHLAAIVQLVALLVVGASCRPDESPRADAPSGPSPRRIVALAPNAAEILCELGECSRLVGVSEFTNFPPELADRPRVGGLLDANLESILTLNPDLVILRGRNDNLEQLCRNRGTRVYRDPTETLPDLYRTIEQLGSLVDRSAQAASLGQRLRKQLAAIHDRVRDRTPVSVLLTVRSPDRLADVTTVARGSYLHDLLELAGGRNIFGELDVAYPQVSVEEIMARQPQVILEAVPGADSATIEAMVAQWQRLGTIPAVQTNRIHVLTEDYALIPSPRVVLLTQKLASLLHPEAGRD